ncbi:MAG: hypothetical protein J0I14_09995 [Propionibacteriaceae bacterium]|nr:hypothetical protein [Propionibacteriaceae bacterium]
MKHPLASAGLALVLLLFGCGQPVTPSPSPSPSPASVDFTKPGAARSMVTKLMAMAFSRDALMVVITRTSVQVTVPGEDQPVSWAYRDGQEAKVASDLQDVGQARFTVSDFNIGDVGALFRAAAGQSGSSQDQSLTIVGTENTRTGDVQMSVSTVPESRTVFFTATGALLEILDFDTPGGLKRGIVDAIGGRGLIYSLTVISNQGAWSEFPGTNNTTLRRTRSAKIPAITTVRSAATNPPLFSSSRVDAAAIWRVVERVRNRGDASAGSAWSVTVDARDEAQGPRLYFTFGFTQVVADLAGNIISQ